MSKKKLDEFFAPFMDDSNVIIEAVAVFEGLSRLQKCDFNWDKNREIIRVFDVMKSKGFSRLTFSRGKFHGIKNGLFWIFRKGSTEIYHDEKEFLTSFHYTFKFPADQKNV